MEKIEKLETFEAKVPLPEPIQVGSTTLRHRTYTVVKVTTSGGITGVGYCYSRGLPLKEIVDNMISQVVIGKLIDHPEAIRADIYATYWHSAEHGTFTAAVSAVDIAIWDALAKSANFSVAKMLGQRRQTLPISYVIGYKYGEDESGLIRDVESAMSRGIRNFKMVVGAGTPERDAKRMKAVRELVGSAGRIGADAFRSFKDLDDATRRVNLLSEFDLSFIEDPFLESQGILMRKLKDRTGAIVAVGESQSGHRGIANIVNHDYADLIRIDALLVGGVKEFLLSAGIASGKGLKISTHIHTEIHAQLAATIDNLDIGGLEYMDPKLDVDLFHLLINNPIEVINGEFHISDLPGFGIDWNWDAVNDFSDN